MAAEAYTQNQKVLANFIWSFKSQTSAGAGLLEYLENSKAIIVRCERDKHLRDIWWLYVVLPSSVREVFSTEREVIVSYIEFKNVQPRFLKDLTRRARSRMRSELRLDSDIAFVASPHRNILSLAKNPQSGFSVIPLVVPELAGPDSPTLKGLLERWLPVYDRYYVTVPLSKSSDLFGRRDELAELNHALNNGQSAGVFGLRKAGKTSVLNAVKEQREERGAFIVQLDLSKVNSARHFVKLLLEEVYAAAGRLNDGDVNNRDLHCIGADGKASVSSDHQWMSWFDDLNSLVREIGHPLELVIDEIDTIFPGQGSQFTSDELVTFGVVMRQLRGLLQAGMDSGPSAVMLCAGVNPAIFERSITSDGRNNQLYKLVQMYFLSPLSRDETALMVRRIGEKMGVKYGDFHTTLRLFELFGGHPMLTRAACSAISKGRPDAVFPWTVSVADIDRAASARGLGSVREQASEIRQSFASWFPEEAALLRDLWSDDPPLRKQSEDKVRANDRLLLHALAYGVVDVDGVSPRIRVVAEAFTK